MESVEDVEQAVASLRVAQPNVEALRAHQRSQMIRIAYDVATIAEGVGRVRRRRSADALLRLESLLEQLASHKNATPATRAAAEKARGSVTGHRAFPRRRATLGSRFHRLRTRLGLPARRQGAAPRDGKAPEGPIPRPDRGSAVTQPAENTPCQQLLRNSRDLEDAATDAQLLASFLRLVDSRSPSLESAVRTELQQSLHAIVAGEDDPSALAAWHTSDGGCVPVFVGGFGWSGSGAVEDYLRGFTGVEPFSRSEVHLLNARTVDGIKFATLHAYDDFSHRSRVDLIRWLARVTFGVSPTMTLAQVDSAQERCLASTDLNDEQTSRQYRSISRFLRRVSMSGKDAGLGEAIATAFPHLLKELAVARSPEASHCLFGNLIRPSELETLQLLPPGSRYVAVTRDPRDMYVDRFAAGKLRWGIEEYCDRLAKSLATFTSFRTTADLPTQLVSFEEFLQSRSVRSEVISFVLGAGPDDEVRRSAEESEYFSLSASLQNVGKHRGFPPQSDIAAIGARFPDQLHA